MFTELDPRNGSRFSSQLLRRDVYFPGQVIIEQGSSANRAFYIESGRVEIEVSENSRSVVVSTAGPGEIFGEMALISDSPRSATVRAVEETVLSEIARDELEMRVERLEDRAIRALIHLFVQRLNEANTRQLAHYRNLTDFQDRVCGLMDKAADTKLPPARRDLFREEVAPLLDELEQVLEKYRAGKEA